MDCLNPSKTLKTIPNRSLHMGKTYYTYEGKKKALGGISKMFNDLVLVEDDWTGAIQDHFKLKGYENFLSLVKTIVRTELSIELTDAQAWLVLHDVTNDGVPMPLRDEKNDEDANAATYVAAVAGAVAGAVLAPVDSAVGMAQNVAKKVIPSGKSAEQPDNTD